MQFSTALVALMATIGAVQASPAPAAEAEATVYLWNGTANVPVQFLSRDTSSLAMLEKRATLDCKGSSRCSNKQSFKDDCSNAYYKVEDTTYTSRGTGKCGLFVAGPKSCYAKGSQLSAAYNAIRQHGCEACGREFNYGAGATQSSCALQIDYVSGCTV